MSTAALASILPRPTHTTAPDGTNESHEEQQQVAISQETPSIPPYGKRSKWRPKRQEDFGDGGAYPECHIAQYPLDMGRKKSGSSGGSLSLQVDADGNVLYDAIVKQGRHEGQFVQSQHKDLVPMRERTDIKDFSMDRPDEASVMDTAERTRQALEKITQSKIKTAQPNHVPDKGGSSSYIRYTPGQQGGDQNKQRIIKMTEAVEDPLEPPRWKFKKIPKGPPSPPPPVLRSPPRKVSAQEQKEWMIPPCVSNWKNNKGYTIPLDKRLAADGRGLQDVYINDGFAQFSESLNLADRHAREEVRQRSLFQQKLAAKEKAAREEHLRQLAQRAREERSGLPTSGAANTDTGIEENSRTTAVAGGSMATALAGYGSGSEERASESDEEDDDAARERDRLREERRREREREMRMSNMGTEQRAKMLAKEQNRDISEKIALGLAKPTAAKDQMDSRLFNQEKLSGSFADEDSYALYDKPLFQGSSAAAAIYKRPAGSGTADDIYGGGTAEGISEEMSNDRFGLGKSKAFEGAEYQEPRTGPVQFEKDTSDPFAIDQFLDDAKRGTKRGGLEETTAGRNKRPKD